MSDWRGLLVGVGLAVFAAYAWSSCAAQVGTFDALLQPQGFQVRMPNGPKAKPTSAASGMSLRVEADAGDSYGYRTVRFHFDAPAAATGDQQITAKLYVGRYGRRGNSQEAIVTVERDGERPGGEKSVVLILPTPRYEPWQVLWWDVCVDGVRDADLSRAADQAFNYTKNHQPQQPLSVFDLHRRRPRDWRRSFWLNGAIPPYALVRHTPPRTWLGYTQHDAVSSDLPSLETLRRQSPQEFDALCRWVESGGSLWVADIKGDSYGRLDALLKTDRQFAWTPDEGAALEGPAEGWEWAWLRDPRDSSTPVPSAEEWLDLTTRKKRERPPGNRGWFAEKRYGFGVVVAFLPSADIVKSGNRWWLEQAESTDGSRFREQPAMSHWQQRSWTRRHGLVPDAANDHFSHLLVPGVGLAPVTEFQILITLFVIVVGPINYWLLKQRQRTHLMVLTVPIAAVGLTSALLLYALLADGFGTQVRVRSVTLLDQANGEHATWGRLSYYSGLAPSEGLSLPDDCVMYPILPGWNELNMAQTSSPTREVEWSEGRQRLLGGWLRSRAPTQYLQVRTGSIDRHLDVQLESATPRVENRLGANIDWLVLLDEQGELSEASGLRDGRATELKPIERIEAVKRLREVVLLNEPTPPEGLVKGDGFSLVEQERRAVQKRLQRDLELQYATVRTDQSLLNQVIDELAGLSGGGTLRLPPRSYVAIAESTVGVDLGLERVSESGSFHVVIGRW